MFLFLSIIEVKRLLQGSSVFILGCLSFGLESKDSGLGAKGGYVVYIWKLLSEFG